MNKTFFAVDFYSFDNNNNILVKAALCDHFERYKSDRNIRLIFNNRL